MIPAYRIPQLAELHREAINTLLYQLATNFDQPSTELINQAISRMGIDRATYQRIFAFLNGWQHTELPQRLLAEA
jgi:hypothetical protein